MSLKVEQYVDLGTHGMFICSVTEARVMSDQETMTYTYYQNNVKPKPQTEGKKGFVCKVCGDEKREVLPKTDHQHTEIRNKEEATCTEGGYTGDTYCTDCGEKLSSGKETPATGHIHIGYLGKKEATCENDGYTGDAYCKDCGITLEIGKNIPALGHTWEKKSVISPTYTKKGTITYICKRCKEKKAVTTKKLAYPKVGTRYTISGSTYKVTKAGAEVMVYKLSLIHI